MIRLIIILLFFALYGPLYCQNLTNYEVTSISEQNGLPSNEVYDIVEDQNGFIWFATDNGVSRFNGLKHHIFDSRDGIEGNAAYHLFLQKDTSIVAVNNRGVFYKIKDGEVTVVIPKDSLTKYIRKQDYPFSFFEDRNGNYQIGTRKNKLIFRGDGALINDVDKDISVKRNQIIIEKKENESLFSYKLKNLDFPYQSFQVLLDEKIVDTVTKNKDFKSVSIYPSISGEYTVVPIFKGILIIDTNGNVQRINFNFTVISSYISNHELFVCSLERGVHCYDLINGRFEKTSILFDHLSVSAVLKDSNNKYWIATLEDGVKVIDKKKAQKIFHAPSTENIITIKYYNGKNYIGFQSGSLWKEQKEIWKSEEKLFSINSINDKLFACDGYLLEVTEFGVSKIEFRGEDRIGAFSITRFDSSMILMLSDYSISLLDLKDSRVIDKLSFKTKISDALVMNDMIVISTENEVIKLKFNNKLKVVSSNPLRNCSDLFYHDETLYGLTKSGQIYEINKDGINQVFTIPFLPNQNGITASLYYEGILHIASNLGLYSWKLSTTTHSTLLLNYEETPFVQSIDISNDTLFYATKKEVYRKALNDFNVQLPKVFIKGVSIEKNFSPGENPIIVEHNFAGLTIQLDIISFSETKPTIRYIIHGLNESYRYTSDSYVAINDLPPGEYSIEIAATIDGVNYSNINFIDINVKPPIWGTWWFIIIVILLASGSIILVVRWRILRIKKMHKIEEDIVSLKSKALMAQLNPHMIFNVMNSIQGLVSEGQIEEANVFISEFSMFVRDTLDYSSLELISLDEEWQMLSQYIEIEKIRFGDEIRFEIKTEVENGEGIQVPPLFIQPIVENAIKHGLLPSDKKEKNIEIEFKEDAEFVKIIVSDNGVGIDEDFKYGVGMTITKDRIQLLNSKNGIIVKRKVNPTVIEIRLKK